MLLAEEAFLFQSCDSPGMQIRCADCGCLPSECKVALRRANVPIVQRENIAAAAGILQRIASFSEAEALG